MPVDMKAMRRKYDEQQRGGDIWTPDVGVNLVYIHDMCRPDDEHEPTTGVNYIPVVVHYGLGRDRQMAVCLDPERNPIIRHPFVRALLKKRKIKLGKTCDCCEAIMDGTLSADAADEAAPSTRFLWGLTPIGHMPSKSSKRFNKVTPKPQVALVGSTLFNGIMDVFFEAGDVCDFDAAVYLQIIREGKGRFDTKYEVKALGKVDGKVMPGSTHKPAKLPAAFRRMINKALQVEGDCDLFRIIANMVKSPEDVKALVSGVAVETDEGDDGDDGGDDDLLGMDGDDDGSELLDGDDDELPPDDDGDDDSELLDGDDDGDGDDGDDLLGGDDDDAGSEDDDGDLLDGDDTEGEEAPEDASEDTEESSSEDDDLGLDELDAELERISKKRAEAKKAAEAKKGKPAGKSGGKPADKGGTKVAKKRQTGKPKK
ncbi:MAG: hypothetical protein ACWGQW_00795 [bacterium]